MKTKLMLSAVVLIALALSIALVYFLKAQEPTGNVVIAPTDGSDFVEINSDDLKICCELENGEGCYVLPGKSCSYCSDYC